MVIFRNFASSSSSRGLLTTLALILAAAAFVGVPTPATPTVLALSNGVALTPPMGWNSWYGAQCDVTDDIVRSAADSMVSSGMRAAGYYYVNVDDCWQGDRSTDGTITVDTTRFPHGMKSLVDYVHSRGLKFGLYTDVGATTCMGLPGSLNHEQQDTDTYSHWGVDFVKVDWCDSDGLDAPIQYSKMRDALSRSGSAAHHPMVFSICTWGLYSPWAWGPSTGNMWRTGGDSGDPDNQWLKVLDALDKNAAHAAVARPGAWNDPDALEVGLGSMSGIEDRAQFTLWAMMAAPLLVSNDPASMDPYTKQTLTNADVIAIDQDPAGVQGTVIQQDLTGQLQVWTKPLRTPGTWAVALFNRSAADTPIQVNWSALGVRSASASVRDLWAGGPAMTVKSGYSATVPSHGVVLLKVTAVGAAPGQH